MSQGSGAMIGGTEARIRGSWAKIGVSGAKFGGSGVMIGGYGAKFGGSGAKILGSRVNSWGFWVKIRGSEVMIWCYGANIQGYGACEVRQVSVLHRAKRKGSGADWGLWGQDRGLRRPILGALGLQSGALGPRLELGSHN